MLPLPVRHCRLPRAASIAQHRGIIPAGVTAAQGPPNDHPDPFCRALRPEPLEIRRTLIEMRSRFATPYGEDLVGKLELVVAEILNNIAEHGGEASARGRPIRKSGVAGHVHLSIAHAEGGLFCIVCDDGDAVPGACFAPTVLRTSPGTIETLPEGGFGWPLICEITEKLYYHPDNGHNVLAFLVPKTSPPAAA